MKHNQVSSHRRFHTMLFLLCVLLMGLFISLLFIVRVSYQSAAAEQVVVLDSSALSPDSIVQTGNATQSFDLYADDGYLYKGQSDGLSTVVEFLEKNPQVTDGNVQGVSSDKKKSIGSVRKLVPAGFLQKSKLTRKSTDSTDRFLLNRGIKLTGDHYFFRQQIGKLPVYKSRLAVHLRNGDEVYGLSGKLAINETVPPAVITTEEAKNIALSKASNEFGTDEVEITAEALMVLNKKILGISNDETNYPVLQATVSTKNNQIINSANFFVSLLNGDILFEDSLTRHALDRNIYDCTGPGSECTLVRTEGSPVLNDSDIDDMYSYLGQVHGYFQSSFQRDSYDNQGGPLTAFVHITDEIECPNALWVKAPHHYFFICDEMVGLDVIAHEYTHGVTEFSGELISSYQSGALDEAFSDVFAYALDPDWTLGEDTVLGTIRNGNDPTRDPVNRGGPHPDRLFSPNYFCGSGDNGGVHQNLSVIVKAFYLMVQGGSFNGCSMAPIGRDKAHAIFYRALTTYLNPTDNFRSAYNSLTRACDDLYNPGSATCIEAKKSLQAVEIDQQPAGTQTGASCDAVQRQTPTCVGATTAPTATPTRVPTGISTPTPTRVPSGIPTPTSIVQPTVTQPQRTPTPTRAQITITPRPSATPIVQITPPAGSIILNLSLRFQGVLKRPTTVNTMTVRVGIRTENEDQPTYSTGTFTAQNNGIWTGSVFFSGKSAGQNYVVYVKGPKHIQKKICVESPVETYEGSYHCSDEGSISLQIGENTLDFSHIYQLVGDLPEQDGLANSYDLTFVRIFIGLDIADANQYADLNLDDRIDTQDYALMLQALSFRYDE